MDAASIKGKIPDYVLEIMVTIQEEGYQAYLVGGSLRDIIMNITPCDYDIATNAYPDVIEGMFDSTEDYGKEFGTITIITEGGVCEVTTLRTEKEYEDFRRPSRVDFSNSLAEDLSRRDFTINALAFDGEVLYDNYDGYGDLKSKIVRTVGNPVLRFSEDGLRLIRAVRFASQLGFQIERNTREAIYENNKLIRKISKERIRIEMDKILLSNRADYGFEILHASGLLRHMLSNGPDKDKLDCRLKWDLLSRLPQNITHRLAAVFLILHHEDQNQKRFSTASKDIGSFCDILKTEYGYEKKRIQRVQNLINEIKYLPYQDRCDIRKMLSRIGNVDVHGDLDYIFSVCEWKGYEKNIIKKWKFYSREEMKRNIPVSREDLAINGNDAMRLGLEKGPEIGQLLDYLLVKTIEDPDRNNRKKLCDLARSWMKQKRMENR